MRVFRGGKKIRWEVNGGEFRGDEGRAGERGFSEVR